MNKAPNARQLIMGLLLAEQPLVQQARWLSSRQVVLACRLFGISENSARVALARLSAAGLVASAGRGTYRLGEAALALAGDVASWREAESRLRAWSGHWILVCCGMLGRTDRPALARRQRALAMLGFRELEKDIYCRPDNLLGGVAAVRSRLQMLGLEPQALVLLASELEDSCDQGAQHLWDGEALNLGYQQQHQRLAQWLALVDALSPEDAARESWLLGSQAIRQIVFDPLLPEPLVDIAARHRFIDMAKTFDRAGYAIWQRLFQSHFGSPGDENDECNPH